MRQLEGQHLTNVASYFFTHYAVGCGTAPKLHADTKIEDLFRPQFWANHAKRLMVGDIVRVRAADGSWDVQLTVVAKQPGGVVMDLWPKYPDMSALLNAAGLSKAADDVKPVLRPQKVRGKDVPRVEHTPATKWRLIGLDGNEVSRDHDSKEHAELAMAKYLAALGYERIETAA